MVDDNKKSSQAKGVENGSNRALTTMNVGKVKLVERGMLHNSY